MYRIPSVYIQGKLNTVLLCSCIWRRVQWFQGGAASQLQTEKQFVNALQPKWGHLYSNHLYLQQSTTQVHRYRKLTSFVFFTSMHFKMSLISEFWWPMLYSCAANFLALLNLLKGKVYTLCGMFLLYPSLTELPSIEIKWALQDVSEFGYLFHDKSSLHIEAWDLDVERSQLCISLGW